MEILALVRLSFLRQEECGRFQGITRVGRNVNEGDSSSSHGVEETLVGPNGFIVLQSP